LRGHGTSLAIACLARAYHCNIRIPTWNEGPEAPVPHVAHTQKIDARDHSEANARKDTAKDLVVHQLI
jgi:hypothetical protein